MPDPVSPAVAASAATIAAAAAIAPALQVAAHSAPQIAIYGVAIGLRADLLLAGFFGSLVAISFFNAVPATGDTARELLRTTGRRMLFAIASAVTAGYITPLLQLIVERDSLHVPTELLASVAFVAGVGAQQLLARFVKREADKIAPVLEDADAH